MTHKQPARETWAKLVPLNPDKRQINCYAKQNQDNQYEAKNQWRIYQKPPEDTWIINLSETYLKVDSNWLEPHQQSQLFGGEKLAFCRENKEKNISFDYVFCFVYLQDKNHLKRSREDESSTSQPSSPKLLKIDNSIQEAEITCSICLGILTRCATLGPCGHNFCGDCLVKHLRNSLFCPLCKTKIVSVIKHLAFQNMIGAVIKNSPNLQRPSNDDIATIQKDLDGNVFTDEKCVFIGRMLDGNKEGPGTQISTSGKIFQGFWKNNKKEGEGTLVLKDRSVLTGVWSNNLMKPLVQIAFEDGTWYKGETKNLEFHGWGTLRWSDGDVYEGDFNEGVKEGFGKYLYSNGGKYEGDWVDGDRQGFGTMEDANGSVYKGEWKKDKRGGNGVQTLKNGDKYEGAWIDDGYNGIGKYRWADGEEYEGNFADSKRDGQGTMEYLNGDVYKGGWKKDHRHGKGIIILSNGDKIEGQWRNNILQPIVTIGYADGSKYKGEIKPRTFERHGKGVLTFRDGSRYEGYWIDDKYDENGKYTSKGDGRVCEEVWKSGSLKETFMTCADGTQYRAKWEKVKRKK